MREEWRDIRGYEGYYQVSNFGNVRGIARRGCSGKVLKPSLSTTGYPFVVLSVGCEAKSRKIHRLVAEAFVPNPDGLPEVNHINGDKEDFRIENLEWVTHKENLQHAARTGLWRPRESQKASAELKKKAVVRSDGALFASLHDAAKESGTCAGNVCKVLKGIRPRAGGYSFSYYEEETS